MPERRNFADLVQILDGGPRAALAGAVATDVFMAFLSRFCLRSSTSPAAFTILRIRNRLPSSANFILQRSINDAICKIKTD